MFWGKFGFIVLNSFCLIITLYTIRLASILKQRFSSPWAWLSYRCPGFPFFPKMNHLQHRFLSATTAEAVEGRQAGKDGKRREFQKGNLHNTCGVKKAASILPLKERVSKTYPSHKIAAEVIYLCMKHSDTTASTIRKSTKKKSWSDRVWILPGKYGLGSTVFKKLVRSCSICWPLGNSCYMTEYYMPVRDSFNKQNN